MRRATSEGRPPLRRRVTIRIISGRYSASLSGCKVVQILQVLRGLVSTAAYFGHC